MSLSEERNGANGGGGFANIHGLADSFFIISFFSFQRQQKKSSGRLFMRWILFVYIFVKFNVPVHFYHDFVHIYTKVLTSFIFIFIFS